MTTASPTVAPHAVSLRYEKIPERDPAEDLIGGDLRAYAGCETVRIPAEEFDDNEELGRIECWDSVTETAQMLCSPTTHVHETPSRRLGQMLKVISQVRGAPITCVGCTDLIWRADDGHRFHLEADEAIYLRFDRDAPKGKYIEVRRDQLPNVVLEVDHTTNVRHRRRKGRRSKLDDYASMRLPELWIEVPDATPTRGQPWPSLTILLLVEGEYVESPTSRAFPGWKAVEIHAGLNETRESKRTVVALCRVGRALGVREGRDLSGDLFLRLQRAAGHRAGRAEGVAEGRSKGRAEGRKEGYARGRVATVRDGIAAILASRGIPMSAALEQWLQNLDQAPDGPRMLGLAATCRDADDLLETIVALPG